MNPNIENYQILIKTQEEKRGAVRFLEGLGYSCPNSDIRNGVYVNSCYIYTRDDNAIDAHTIPRDYKKIIEFSQLHTIFLAPEPIKVKLNASYTAEVTKDQIKVGCTTFPISIVENLKKGMAKLQTPINLENVCIECRNLDEKKAAANFLGKILGRDVCIDEFNSRSLFVFVSNNTYNVTAHVSPNGSNVIKFTEIHQLFLSPKAITIQLNSDFTAIIRKDKIEANKSSFPFSVVEELEKAINEINKQTP